MGEKRYCTRTKGGGGWEVKRKIKDHDMNTGEGRVDYRKIKNIKEKGTILRVTIFVMVKRERGVGKRASESR